MLLVGYIYHSLLWIFKDLTLKINNLSGSGLFIKFLQRGIAANIPVTVKLGHKTIKTPPPPPEHVLNVPSKSQARYV